MSAAGNFNAVPRKGVVDVEPGPVVEPHEPFDLDQVQAVAWALVGAVLYLGGVVVAGIGLTVAFGWWVGGLLVLLAGAVPSGYSLAKAHQATAERERRAHAAAFRGEQAGPVRFDAPLAVRP